MSACSNYAENLWKKGKCSNCFRSKEQHFVDNLRQNGDSCLVKSSHEEVKSSNDNPNGLSNGQRQPSLDSTDDGGEFILKGTVKRAGKIYQAPGSEFSKRLSSYQTSTRRKDSFSNDSQNTALLKDGKGSSDSLNKSKPISSSVRERTASKSSNSSEEETNLRCSVWSNSSLTDSKTQLNETKDSVNNSEENIKSIAATESLERKDSYTNKLIPDDKTLSQERVTKESEELKGVNEVRYENSVTGQRKETLKCQDPTMSSKTTESNEKDGEYMPMKSNVCFGKEIETDVDFKVDKITSSNTCEPDNNDTKEIKNKSDSLTSTKYKQNSLEEHNNIIRNKSDRLPSLISEADDANCESSSWEKKDLEHFYENRRSMDRNVRTSSSSSDAICSPSIISSTVSPSDRPESIAFKVHSDLGELRESSLFEDIIMESSSASTTSNSESSKESMPSDSSSMNNNNTSIESDNIKSSSENDSGGKPFDSHPKPSKDETIERWHSNPDVTKLVEGPCYANSEAKPVTKPYKVVDISGGVIVQGSKTDHADTPPLPPKEKELNRQKEYALLDHYYCEPPDDIVPDYKKLTPQNTEPPPILDIKKEQSNSVAESSKVVPVPRPRSQLPSHSSTLPRPMPRAVKVEVDVKDVTRASRPASQVVTRIHKKEAPKPPSTSSIPSRKHTGEISPPVSPTENHNQSPASPERTQYKGANTIDSKDPSIKPKRMAPPPPKATQAPGRVGSPSETRREIACGSPTPIQSKQLLNQTNQSSKAHPKSGIKKALSSWRRLSGRRKNKRKLEISSPILVNDEVESYPAQKDAVERKACEARSTSPVCTNVSERQRESTLLSQSPPDGNPVVETEIKEAQANSSPNLPARKPGRSYQNFPFSKTDMEKPVKPNRPARAVKPVLQVKPEVNRNASTQESQHEAPAYLEPCTGNLTLKVEAALANLNDAKILAETLTRVEQEKLGPLPEVPKSRHVHFRFNETAEKSNKEVSKNPKQSPKRPMTAVAPTVVSNVSDKHKQPEVRSRQPKYPSRPPNTKPFASDNRDRSKSIADVKDTGTEGKRSRCLSTQDNPMKKRYDKILELHRQTLQDMINTSKAVLLPGDSIDLSNTKWNDYVVCGSAMDIEAPGAVLLPVVCPKVDEELTLLAKVKFPKAVTEDMSQRTAYMQDMAVTVSLPSHPNVSRTVTHYTDYLPGEVFGVKNSSDFETLVTITDQVPVETVLEFVERTVKEHAELPDEYERKVCILLLQLFSALVHLHEEGIVHRDIRLNNILLLDHGHLVLSNFSHVLQNSGGDTRFEYSMDSVGHIGRDPCRIPPEIHKAYNCGKSMDYEKCDVFAVGCLIYELLHEPNPFAVDPTLLARDYTISDLPMLTDVSRFTSGLAMIASGILQPDPSMRMLPHEALKFLQAFLWGPEDLDESCLDVSASDWLETERAHAVIMIARNQSHGSVVSGDEFLENFLKYQYLVTLNEEVVIEGYNALSSQESPALAATT